EVAQVERGRPGATDSLRVLERCGDEREVERGMLTPVVRKAGREQGVLEACRLRDRDRGAVQTRTTAPGRREDLLPDRVVDEPEHEVVTARQRERHRELGMAVGEVRRAVERIDVPARLAPSVPTSRVPPSHATR